MIDFVFKRGRGLFFRWKHVIQNQCLSTILTSRNIETMVKAAKKSRKGDEKFLILIFIEFVLVKIVLAMLTSIEEEWGESNQRLHSEFSGAVCFQQAPVRDQTDFRPNHTVRWFGLCRDEDMYSNIARELFFRQYWEGIWEAMQRRHHMAIVLSCLILYHCCPLSIFTKRTSD